jgi:AbiU2
MLPFQDMTNTPITIGATDLLEVVEQDLFRLREAWHIFKFLFATNKRHVDILNAAGPGFFGTIQRMMFDDAILRICRLTDRASTRSQENTTLHRVLEATEWKTTDAALWSSYTAKLAAVDAACADCRSHRNKRISHVDLAWSTKALTLPDATLAMVDRALNSIQEFVEALYHELHSGVSRSFDIPDLGRDAERFINHLANRASQKDPTAVVVVRYERGQQPNAELDCPFCGITEWLSFYPKNSPIDRMTTRAHFDRCDGVIGFERITVRAVDVTNTMSPIEFELDLAVATRETDVDF